MIMFDDPKYKVNWRDIVKWDENNICGFFGEYKWLSNFYLTDVWFEGNLYPSSEHAYMAAKFTAPYDRVPFVKVSDQDGKHCGLSARDAKLIGSRANLNEDWIKNRYGIMSRIVFEKFSSNAVLKEKLLETGDKYLEETLWWQDSYWGVDYKLGGENNLGKILMKVREFLK